MNPLRSFLWALVISGAMTLSGQAREDSSPIRPNSSVEVSRHLDRNGSFYLYWSAGQMAEVMQLKLDTLENMIREVVESMSPEQMGVVEAAFKVGREVIGSSGIEDLSGVGLSSFLVETNLYRNRAFFHHYPEQSDGKLWRVMGTAPRAMDVVEYLPENTVACYVGDLDLSMFWNWIKELVTDSGNPQWREGFASGIESLKPRIDLNVLFGSLGTEIGYALTMDESKPVPISTPAGQVSIPEPGLVLMAVIRNDYLPDLIKQKLAEAGVETTSSFRRSVELTSFKVPLPIPMEFEPTFFVSNSRLVICTSRALAGEFLALEQGEAGGLVATKEFKDLSRGWDLVGNQLTYTSPRLNATVVEILRTLMANMPPEQNRFMNILLQFQPERLSAFGVARVLPDGILFENFTQMNLATTLASQLAVAPAAMAASMALPAMAKAKEKAMSIKCVGNLKQVGLAARLYATDHNDEFPKTIVEMREELGTPVILVCPADPSVTAASNWAEFDPDRHCSYEFFSGPEINETHPGEVMARCPIHDHKLLCDASVQIQNP